MLGYNSEESNIMMNIAVMGAGGNMWIRVCRAMKDDPEYSLLPVEVSEKGLARLEELGLSAVPLEEAVPQADATILALPDKLIGKIALLVVPHVQSGAMVLTLDPAAPYAGKLPPRDDITYFVTHPSHPPVFNDEQDMKARRDFFGSGLAKQTIVCALMQGPEEDYAKGEKIASTMFGPIIRAHRVTVEQMAYLEPVLSETVAATCLTVVREAMDEAIKRGVPEQAARDFILGHINIELAILFNEIDWSFSDGAKKAVSEAKGKLFQPDWKRVFEEEELRESVEKITGDDPS